MNLNYDPNAKGNTDPIPVGIYGFRIEDVKLDKSKEGKPMFKVVLAVCEGPEGAKDPTAFSKRKIFENFMVDQQWRVNHLFTLAKVAGLDPSCFNGFDNPQNHRRLVNMYVKARVTQQARKGEPGKIDNRVDGEQYFPWKGPGHKEVPKELSSAQEQPATQEHVQKEVPFEV